MSGLGYDRFATHGGDWGAFVSAQLGHKHADRLYGTHFTVMTPLDMFSGASVPVEDFAPEEAARLERNRNFMQTGISHLWVQSQTPQSVAYAMNDSPVGLCSWLVQKRRSWSDCGGDVETRFSKDDLLTLVMIYWLTQTYGTSARYYYEAVHRPWQPSHNLQPVVQAPVGVAVFANEVVIQPRRWAERYYNLKRWTEFPSGGHFAAMEEPRAVIDDVRAFYRELRK